MTLHKKCEMPGCGKTLTRKNMHVIKTIPHDADWGYKEKQANKRPAEHGGYWRDNVKHKYKVCGDCYEFWNMDKQGAGGMMLLESEEGRDKSMDAVDKKIEAQLFGRE